MTKKKKAMMRGCVLSCFRTFCVGQPGGTEAGQLPRRPVLRRGPVRAPTRAWGALHMQHDNPMWNARSWDRTCQKPMGFLPPFRQAFKYCSLLAVVTRLEVTCACTGAGRQPAWNGSETRMQGHADHGWMRLDPQASPWSFLLVPRGDRPRANTPAHRTAHGCWAAVVCKRNVAFPERDLGFTGLPGPSACGSGR